MYSLNKKFKMKKKYKYQDEKQFRDLDCFMMPSKRNSGFMICGENISNIMVISYDMAAPLVRSYVSVKYKKLISFLTELLVTDDDNGDSYREALNQIEKFRLQIKNKYRDYLLSEELKLMAKQLGILQKEAKNQFVELQNSLMMTNSNGKNR